MLRPRLLSITAAAAAALSIFFASGCNSSACNGHDALCGRAYDAVTFPGTHNSYSNTTEQFAAANQTYPVTRQLADGVRALHLEARHWLDGAYVCHSVCEIGSKPLVEVLTEIASFLATHDREVVTILFEVGNLQVDEVKAAFDGAGLTKYAHPHVLGDPWLTLGELIGHGERLVVLADDEAGYARFPWWLPRWKFTFQTPWNNQSLADFTRCQADRGDQKNPLYTVDVYLEDLVLAKPANDVRVNRNPFLIDRLRHCQGVIGRRPNFALVNYYEVSDLFAAADAMNGFGLVASDFDAFPPEDAARGEDAQVAKDLGLGDARD